MTTIYFIIGGVVLLGFVVWLYGRSAKSSGKSETIAKAAKDAIEDARKANTIREDVRSYSDDKLNSILRGDSE